MPMSEAHPPSEMELSYDLENQTLTVTITHVTIEPRSHRIYLVEVEKNGELILEREYDEQPENTFTDIYNVAAQVGDVLTVTAYCSLYGSITKSLSVSGGEPDVRIAGVSGGFGVSVTIANIGDGDARSIDWSITVQGGLLGRINTSTAGSIDTLTGGSETTVRLGRVIGLGPCTITVSVDDVERSYRAFILFFYVIPLPEVSVGLETVADGFTAPVCLEDPVDGEARFYVAEQSGAIKIIENGDVLDEPFLDLSDKLVNLNAAYDERGLLGLAFHPDYESNGRFYVYYSAPTYDPDMDHASILAEYRVSDDPVKADPTSERVLLSIGEPEGNHNGGQLAFGPDGYLYVGVGDGGGAGDRHGDIGNGQNISTLLGSVLRIDVDGAEPYEIPADNPFVGIEGRDEIYAYGLRNPWKFSFDSETGQLFLADVGQDKWEEVDIIEKGGNYGWRIMEGTHMYDEDLADELDIDIDSLELPIHDYSHEVGRSITGGYVYRGNALPNLYGTYVFGDWSSNFYPPSGSLFYLEEREPGRWERFPLEPASAFNRYVLGFGQDEDGELYVLSSTALGPTGTSGDVRRIVAP
ncbi:MAG: PQQ-dependent sugar dehydrogenase [Thermoplasmatota archaeon]